MRIVCAFVAYAILAGCATTGGTGSSAPAKMLPPEHHAALNAIATWKFGQSREPLTVVEAMVREALVQPDGGRTLAGHLAAMLATDATLECKDFVCRQLWLIGTEDNVNDLAALLTNPQTSDMARYALERIPGKRVDAALIDAIEATSGVTKAGIINSLGTRETTAATAALRALASNRDPMIAEAATAALRRIGS